MNLLTFVWPLCFSCWDLCIYLSTKNILQINWNRVMQFLIMHAGALLNQVDWMLFVFLAAYVYFWLMVQTLWALRAWAEHVVVDLSSLRRGPHKHTGHPVTLRPRVSVKQVSVSVLCTNSSVIVEWFDSFLKKERESYFTCGDRERIGLHDWLKGLKDSWDTLGLNHFLQIL